MRLLPIAAVPLLCLVAGPSLVAADDLIEQLATCKVSWLDFKDDAVQSRKFAESFNASFTRKANTQHFVPKKAVLVAGLPVVQAFPQSAGMGVGFSLILDATFDVARQHVEKVVGKPLKDCEVGDGMRSCALELGPKRTIMVMTGDSGKAKQTLVGCYYYYEK
jgi:hypothetical protein